MVRRSLICCIALALLLAVPAQASAAAYDVYDGNISSTYTAIFSSVAAKVSMFDDYVFFRSTQYDYILLVGDFTYESGTFSADEATEYRIYTDSTIGSYYHYTQASVEAVSLTPDTRIVYSNLGPFPDLVDRSTFYDFSILTLLLIFLCMSLIRSIFSFTYRGRYH